MKIGDETHWFLEHRWWRIRIDPSRLQFPVKQRRELENLYDYMAVGSGFLTKRPSKRARKLMRELTWQSRSNQQR